MLGRSVVVGLFGLSTYRGKMKEDLIEKIKQLAECKSQEVTEILAMSLISQANELFIKGLLDYGDIIAIEKLINR